MCSELALILAWKSDRERKRKKQTARTSYNRMDSFDSWSGVKYIIENKRSQTGKYFGSLLWIHCVSGCISVFLCAMPSKCNLATNTAPCNTENKQKVFIFGSWIRMLGDFRSCCHYNRNVCMQWKQMKS